jgi:hypothetical protein
MPIRTQVSVPFIGHPPCAPGRSHDQAWLRPFWPCTACLRASGLCSIRYKGVNVTASLRPETSSTADPHSA